MKKVLFAALCLACMTATGVYAQKGGGKETAHSAGGGSNAREGKNVGKGSPLLQRTAGSSNDAPASKAASAPATEVAPSTAPAPATAPMSPNPAPTDQKKVVPATTTEDKPKE